MGKERISKHSWKNKKNPLLNSKMRLRKIFVQAKEKNPKKCSVNNCQMLVNKYLIKRKSQA